MLSTRIDGRRRAGLLGALIGSALTVIVVVVPVAAAPKAPAATRSAQAAPQADTVYLFVHEVTGTYLETDNYNDNIGEAVQTWNLDPLPTSTGTLGHKWTVAASGDTFTIASFEHGRCLTASATSAADFPRLQTCDGGSRQNWIFRRYGATDDYVIIPSSYQDYALGIRGHTPTNDQYVVPTRMYAAPTWSQYWRLTPAPSA